MRYDSHTLTQFRFIIRTITFFIVVWACSVSVSAKVQPAIVTVLVG